MSVSGYSLTPLAKKLGFKPGIRIRLINEPEYYWRLFNDLPPNLIITSDPEHKKDCVHFFTKEASELYKVLPMLPEDLKPDGMIWVSWPKKAAKIITDVTETTIRDFALKIGLVDIKVCAVNDTWSGLKLVIPLINRK